MNDTTSQRSFTQLFFICWSTMVAVTVIITVLMANVEVLQKLYAGVYVLLTFFAVGVISIAVLMLVEKIHTIPLMNYILISLTVFTWSFAYANITLSLKLWTLLAWFVALAFATTALILGYKLKRQKKKVNMTIVYVTIGLGALSCILLIIGHFTQTTVRIVSGVTFGLTFILMLYLTGQAMQRNTEKLMTSVISIWAAFISWMEVVLLYLSTWIRGGTMNSTEMNNMFLLQILKYTTTSIGMEHGDISDVNLIAAFIAIVICLLLLILLFINKQFNFLSQPFAFALITLMVILWLTADSFLCCSDNLIAQNTFIGVSLTVHALVGFVATYVAKLSVSNCVALLTAATVAFFAGVLFSVLGSADYFFHWFAGACWGCTSAIITFIIVNQINWSKKK
ncbi:unnamed protein product [Trichobilharzia szidati]|nr:unnamed protein product [Trichobilharzia szidati]